MCLETSLNCSIYPHDSSAAFWCQTSRENPKHLQERSPALPVLSTFRMHDLNYFLDWKFCFSTWVLSKWCKAAPVALVMFCLNSRKRSQCLLLSLHQCCGVQQKTETWGQKEAVVCSALVWTVRDWWQCLGVESGKAAGSLILGLISSPSPCAKNFSCILPLSIPWKMDKPSLKQYPEPICPLRGNKWSEFSWASRRITTQPSVSLEEIKLCPDFENGVNFLAVRLLKQKEQTTNNRTLMNWDLPFKKRLR